jgi:hypothetical protein
MGFSIKLDGDQQLIKLFSELPKSVGPSIVKSVATKGGGIVRDAVRQSIPSRFGELGDVAKKSVKVVSVRGNRSAVRVTITGDYQTYKGKQVSVGKIIWHMAGGNQHERHRKSGGRAGQSTGKVRNRVGNIVFAGFDKSKNRAADVMKREFSSILTKKIQKYR